jgi:hypothetical protein
MAEREKGGSWEGTAQSFHTKFPKQADVTASQLMSVYNCILPTKGPRALEQDPQDKACMDLEILRIYHQYPAGSITANAEKIRATSTYKRLHELRASPMNANTFRVRNQWLQDCGITEHKLRHFIGSVKGATGENPYENAPTIKQYLKLKSKHREQSQTSSNHVTPETEDNDNDEAGADEEGDGGQDDLEMLDENISIPEVRELMEAGA